jgi:hypothetical protein
MTQDHAGIAGLLGISRPEPTTEQRMPHRLRARFLCVRERGLEAEAIRDRDALAAGGAVA